MALYWFFYLEGGAYSAIFHIALLPFVVIQVHCPCPGISIVFGVFILTQIFQAFIKSNLNSY